MQGLFDAQAKGRIPNVEFTLFVTDKPNAAALEKAKAFGIKRAEALEAHADETREEYDRALINLLRAEQPDVIILAGWMRILSPLFCEQFGQTTWNVHPSLLPDHAGLMGDEVHREVLNDGDRYTGCSIHRVSAEVDAGEMVLQRKIPVSEMDTVESLRVKVQRQEILGFCEGLERR
jgi:phosphoribosylglycinamide formyltransferase-1